MGFQVLDRLRKSLARDIEEEEESVIKLLDPGIILLSPPQFDDDYVVNSLFITRKGLRELVLDAKEAIKEEELHRLSSIQSLAELKQLSVSKAPEGPSGIYQLEKDEDLDVDADEFLNRDDRTPSLEASTDKKRELEKLLLKPPDEELKGEEKPPPVTEKRKLAQILKTPGTVSLRLKDKSWAEAAIDLETMTVSDLKGKETRSFRWMNKAIWENPLNVKLFIEGDKEPIHLRFSDELAAGMFKKYCERAIEAARLAKHDEKVVDMHDNPENPLQIVYRDPITSQPREIDFDTIEEKKDFESLVKSLRKELLAKRPDEKGEAVTKAKLEEKPVEVLKRFKAAGAVFLKTPDEDWVEATIDLTTSTVRPTQLEPVSILRMSAAEWEGPLDVSLTVDDAEKPVELRFKEREAAEEFKNYCDRWIKLVDLAGHTPQAVQIKPCPDDPNRFIVTNTETGEQTEMTLNDAEELRDLQDLLQQLQRTGLQSLPSMGVSPDSLDAMDQLIKLIKRLCPESLEILHGSRFTIYRRGDEKNGLRMRLLIRKGIFAGPDDPKSTIPPQLRALKNFDFPSRLLELNGMLRGVPLDSDTFLVTLAGDEPRRVFVEEFDTVIEKRAFGDMMNIISRYAFETNYSASLTVNEIKVGQLMAAYKRSRKENTLRMRLKGDTVWSDVSLSNGEAKWEGKLAGIFKEKKNVAKSVSSLLDIESFAQLDRCEEEVKFVGMDDSIVIDMVKPKFQQLFSAYCGNVLKRRMTRMEIMKNKVENQESEILTIMKSIHASHPTELATLARALVGVDGPDVADAGVVHFRFNLICSRLVPEIATESKIESIDLRKAEKLVVLKNMTAELTFNGSGEDDAPKSPVILRFRKLSEFYALYIVFRELKKFQTEGIEAIKNSP